jgi:hypothetical protein
MDEVWSLGQISMLPEQPSNCLLSDKQHGVHIAAETGLFICEMQFPRFLASLQNRDYGGV